MIELLLKAIPEFYPEIFIIDLEQAMLNRAFCKKCEKEFDVSNKGVG